MDTHITINVLLYNKKNICVQPKHYIITYTRVRKTIQRIFQFVFLKYLMSDAVGYKGTIDITRSIEII